MELGDILNLMAAENPNMFHQLSCTWNKSGHQVSVNLKNYQKLKKTIVQIVDKLHEEFLDCVSPDDAIQKRATNTNPNLHPKSKEAGSGLRNEYL